jgi:hypothetical protein
MSNSSSTQTTRYPSSTRQPTVEEAYVTKIKEIPQKPQTVGQIRAAGEVKTRLGILWFVGVVCVILLIIGGSAFILNPEHAKDVWVIIGPIISSAVTGTVAYFAGEKNGSSK